MELLLLGFSAFFIALIAIHFFIPIAEGFGLVDRPSSRKTHVGNVPLIGGISIFISVLTASLIWLPNTLELRLFLIAAAMMVFIGALDDKYDISVRIRIIGQMIIASLMIYGIGGYIDNLGNILGFGDFKLGYFGIIFTYFAIVVAINAFNMIDGIDGLVGVLSLNVFTSIAILFLISGNESYITYPLIIATATIPYLLYNLGFFKKITKKIFMGDAGSMFIGLSVIWLLCMGTQGDNSSFKPVTALWICAIPLMDMLAIVIRRLRNGLSPFKPDRDHLHHLLLKFGLSDRQTLLLITVTSIVFSVFGVLGELYMVAEWLMFSIFVALFVLYSYVLKSIKS